MFLTEKLYTINSFDTVFWQGWSVQFLILGLLLIVAGGFYFYYLSVGKKQQSFNNLIFWLLFFGWLPLVWVSGATHWHYWQESRLYPTEATAKRQTKLCQLDKNQEFKGLMCDAYTTMEQLKNKLPAGSSLYLPNNLVRLYFAFELSQEYNLVNDCAQVDAILSYRSAEKLVYEPNGRVYKILKEDGPDKELYECGRFSTPQVFGEAIYFLERIK